jgi:hypothetical protein
MCNLAIDGFNTNGKYCKCLGFLIIPRFWQNNSLTCYLL